MSKNTGLSYEVLTQSIFQALHDQDQAKNIKVLHDVKLKGKVLEHQIDVYWEFEQGGVVYRAIVQTKDWGQAVSQIQLLAFKAILDDLPDQPRGIFVTRSGYQKGAEDFAKANGILIFELRQPEEEDLKGRIAHMTLTATVLTPEISDVQLLCDEIWLSEERVRRGLTGKLTHPFPAAGMTDQLGLADESGNDLGNIRKFIVAMFKANKVVNIPTKCAHSFKNATFLRTGSAEFPLLKLTGINATILNRDGPIHKSYSTPEGVVGFILKNVTKNSMQVFTDKMQPI